MLVLVEKAWQKRPFKFVRELNILDDIYDIPVDVWVMFEPNVRRYDGTPARGGYAQGQFCQTGDYQWHIVHIDESLDLIEAATVLIHEYAHVLSQQNHGFMMYELWREYLREEFRRRWKDVIREKDTDDDRGRVVVVGEVRNGEEVEHLSDNDDGSGQEDCSHECTVRGIGRSPRRRCDKDCTGH